MGNTQIVLQQGKAKKSCAILLLTVATWLSVSFVSWKWFYITVPLSHGLAVFIVLRCLHMSWMLFWLWGIHNLWHQTLSFLPRKRSFKLATDMDREAVAVLYTTCDDFDPKACQSCLDQTHPRTRLIICDDSQTVHFRNLIDAWANGLGPHVTVIRRPYKYGFKAGNLNYTISRYVKEEFVLICDADELIPSNFVERLLPYFCSSDIAFVQARHTCRQLSQTRFAKHLGPSVDIFYKHTLPLRNRFGFVSCFGHGVVIRRSAWRATGGFPEMVSEDLAFASRALIKGFRGIYAEDVVAEEAFPSSYTAFVSKYRKIIGGTIEYFQKELLAVIRSEKVTITEKIDLIITFSYCFIGLVTIVNILGGIVLAYIYGLHGYSRLQPWLICLYLVGPLTPILPLVIGLFKYPKKYVQYPFSAAIAYVGLIPTLAFKGIEQLLRLRKPDFEATGKVGFRKQRVRDHFTTEICGLFVLSMAVFLYSPVFALAIGTALMFLLSPLMCFTERSDALGLVARHCGVFPYAVIVFFLWKLS